MLTLWKVPTPSALDEGPEAFNRLRMDGANDVLLFRVIDDTVRVFLAKVFVTYPLIDAEQADFVRDGVTVDAVRAAIVVEYRTGGGHGS